MSYDHGSICLLDLTVKSIIMRKKIPGRSHDTLLQCINITFFIEKKKLNVKSNRVSVFIPGCPEEDDPV